MFKKISLTFVFSIFLTVDFCLAQDIILVPQKSIDSLQLLIKVADNEEEVRLLNEYARNCFYNEDYMNGFNSTLEARKLAKELDFIGGEIMYHYTLGVFFGFGEMYLYHMQKARLLSTQLKQGVTIEEATMPARYRPEATESRIEKLKPVYEYFKALGEKEIQASIADQLGFWYYFQGAYDELKKVHLEFTDIYKELGELYPLIIYYRFMHHVADFENNEERKDQLKEELEGLFNRLSDPKEIGPLNFHMANFYRNTDQHQLAIKYYLLSISYLELIGDLQMVAEVYFEMGSLYRLLEMHEKEADIIEKQINALKQFGNYSALSNAYGNAVWSMLHAKRYDDARAYLNILLQDTSASNFETLQAQQYSLEGEISIDFEKYEEAIPNLEKALEIYVQHNHGWSEPWVASHLATCYYEIGDFDIALEYALSSVEYSKISNTDKRYEKRIDLIISRIYEAQGKEVQAFRYLKKYHNLVSTDIDESSKVVEALLNSALERNQEEIEQLEEDRALKEQQNKTQRLWILSIAGALISSVLLALMLYRNNKHKQKANALLKEQKEEIESTLDKLESTQSQLIQSEKMASLGELTAGIAHEIQNPLNFVNNFSEVNKELIEELEAERSKREGERDEKLEEEILKDLKENEEKIKHHGQRAEGIVKGMLQHSRTSQGEREPTDINALADEYLRLAYHGLRAKDKSFNADFKTEFDEALPKVNVIPQDIGRVLLNLINNAFYAVDKKAKEGIEGYKPEVIVTTKLSPLEGGVRGVKISVSDNGPGIPEKVRDKIFQPFFTTKPTGSGTGLGLSLSYDIVTQGHDGHLEVETEEGIGTRFIVILPV